MNASEIVEAVECADLSVGDLAQIIAAARERIAAIVAAAVTA